MKKVIFKIDLVGDSIDFSDRFNDYHQRYRLTQSSKNRILQYMTIGIGQYLFMSTSNSDKPDNPYFIRWHRLG